MRVAKVFLDSSLFFYSIDEEQTIKRDLAQQWLISLSKVSSGITNLQVLNEVTNVILKRRRNIEAKAVFEIVDGFAEFGSLPMEASDVGVARRIRHHINYSWWDCVLLASALRLDCTHFLSEDLQDGRSIEGLTVVDPFAHSPSTILAPR